MVLMNTNNRKISLNSFLLFLVFLLLMVMTQTVSAFEFNNTKFILNGQNIKTATWFNIEVYKIFLYLEEKNSDYEDIVSNKEKKLVKMEFLMDVSKEKLVAAWTEDVASSCIRDCDRQVKDVKEFLKKMPGVNEGESVYYYITPDNIDVYVDKTKIGTLSSKFIDKSVLLTMIGKTSPAKMKNKLLGISLPQVSDLSE